MINISESGIPANSQDAQGFLRKTMRNAQKKPAARRTAGKDVISGCFFCRSLRLFFVQFFQYFSAVLLDHPRHKLGAALHVQICLFLRIHTCADQFPSFHEFPASLAAGINPALFPHVTGKEKPRYFTLGLQKLKYVTIFSKKIVPFYYKVNIIILLQIFKLIQHNIRLFLIQQ